VFIVASFVVAHPTVFGHTREEVGGECRQLHHLRVFVTCTACKILWEWWNDGGWDVLGHVECMGDKCVHSLVVTSEGKRLLGKPMCRKADSIKSDLENKGWLGGWGGGFLGWIHPAWVAVAVNTTRSHCQYYIQVNSQLYSPVTLHQGKVPLVYSSVVFSVLVLDVANPLSADRAVVIQCIAIYCSKLPHSYDVMYTSVLTL